MQRASNAAWKIGGLKRGSTAFKIASARSVRASSAIAAGIGGVDGRGGEARVAGAIDRRLRPRRVDVRQDHPLEESAPLRHRGDGGSHSSGSDHEDAHAREPTCHSCGRGGDAA